MAINPANFGNLNARAGQIVLTARDALQQILFFNDYIQELGVSGLVNLGFTSDDANLLIAVYGNMASVANMCMGQPYVGPTLPFNFLGQTIPLWAGQ